MNKMFIVSVIDTYNNKHLGYHRFKLPEVGQPGFYRETTSYNAFVNNEKRHWNGRILYYAQHESDMFREPEPNVPMTIHPNIWSFYKAIGFDYKKGKYDYQR